jgi:hypothetical protein
MSFYFHPTTNEFDINLIDECHSIEIKFKTKKINLDFDLIRKIRVFWIKIIRFVLI